MELSRPDDAESGKTCHPADDEENETEGVECEHVSRSTSKSRGRYSGSRHEPRFFLFAQGGGDRLNERDVLVTFPAQKPHCTTRLVLKTPKTETSTRVVWLPKTVAHMLVEHRQNQEELKEFLGADYHDYNLVVALENGNPVESRIIRKRLQVFCDTTGYERVDFHSLRHLSTKYKLKLTQGDIKSVQGDTGHAEAQMVTDVYSEIEDENRRENAARMEADFYSPTAKNGKSSATEDIGEALAAILKNLSPEQLSALVSAAR